MATTTRTAVTVKQGKPSKPGEKVDTSKAAVVPESQEVKNERKGRQPAVDAAVSKMTTSAPKKAPAKPQAERKTKLGHALTKTWPSKTGREVKKGDEVKMNDDTTGVVDSRFTMQQKDARVPYVCVRPKNGGKGHHVPSATVTHTTKK